MASAERKEPTRRYSGPGSKKFWKRINNVPYSEGGRELYVMGCILQDTETKLLTLLEAFERRRKQGVTHHG